MTFQSTPPARGATLAFLVSPISQRGFNPRPPRGGRPFFRTAETAGRKVSIHAPRAGGDFNDRFSQMVVNVFQSTPPARGATRETHHLSGERKVSIHAPRAGGDSNWIYFAYGKWRFNPRPPRGGRRDQTAELIDFTGFNPRPPRGGRHFSMFSSAFLILFQSTPPARGATRRQGSF